MAATTQVYEDRWGSMIDRPDASVLEIRWYDTTASMSRSDFEAWLQEFASKVEQTRRAGVLVDATSFLMDPAFMNDEWRNAHIVPRYNAAGLRKFAFLMPRGMPMIGVAPAIEGPAAYPTAYFGERLAALDWLAG